MTHDTAQKRVEAYRARVDKALDARLPASEIQPARLHQAMRYCTLGGGKRLRPILVYASGETTATGPAALDAVACAVEMIHVYSLVHDDLPAMDNDDLRRGKPSCHKAFDEATAILAGDALQTLAFQLLAGDDTAMVEPGRRLQMIATLAQASGSRGMAGGQAIDLDAVGRTLTLVELENMHIHKTGALIRASVLLGALCNEALSDDTLDDLDRYAKCIGLAFQIQDDILDVVADTGTLGKTQGADEARGKPTYPALLGLDGAREHARLLVDEAIDRLAPLGARADTLRWIARYVLERRN